MSLFHRRRPLALTAGTSWMPPAGTVRITPPPDDRAATEPLRRQPDDRPLRSIARVPGPSFTPATGAPTMPTRVLPPGQPAAPFDGYSRQPRAEAAAARAQAFAADMRSPKAGGLPVFAEVARSVGWCGLHGEQPWVGYARYTFARWQAEQMAAIDSLVALARAEAAGRTIHAKAMASQQFDAYLSGRRRRAA